MYTKYFSIANLKFSVSSEEEYNYGIAEEIFSIPQTSDVDAKFQILTENFNHNGKEVFDAEVYKVFEDDNNFYREYTNNLGVFVFKREKNNPYSITIYGNKEDLSIQQQKLIQGYLGLEVPLIYHNTYILHSSFVKIHNSGVIFCAPSQVGKSTQADLWNKYKGAEVINGDRTCLKVYDDHITGFGSIFAGSSGIYKNESADIKAIIILEQAEDNSLIRLSKAHAFTKLYSQTLTNSWDKNIINLVITNIEKTLSLVPVYLLKCRADEEAVDLLYSKLFD